MTEPSPKAGAAGANLVVDSVTLEAISTLKDSGIRAILLKGPSIASWIYEPHERAYSDTDLLIAPDTATAATHVLRTAGYTSHSADIEGDRPVHEIPLRRDSDGALVELHTTIPATQCQADLVWKTLSSETEQLDLRGTIVEALNEPARAFHVALHALHHRGESPRALEDLSRAIGLVDVEIWKQATAIARRLQSTDAFTTGLRLGPGGDTLVERVGLDGGTASLEVALRARGVPPESLAFDWFMTRPGIRAKATLVLRKTFPPPSRLRELSPLARRGTMGLALAYIVRPARLAVRAARGGIAWRGEKKRLDV